MIGVGFNITIKKSRLLTDPQRALALPMVEVTRYLASLIIARIRRGQGPVGPWNTYAADERSSWREYFWVAPGRPQPGEEGRYDGDGLLFRVKKGPWAGWAAYASAKAYYRERGMLGRPHDFEESGELLKRLSIRIVTPRHIRLAFYGGHGKMLAKQIAWFASRSERYPLLMPSADEVKAVQAYVAKHINEAIIEGARLGEQAQILSARSRSVSRLASKLLGD